MSTIPTNTEISPFTIKTFLGLNLSTTGDTQLSDGESGNMTNFVITKDYKLRKCDGYKCVYNFAHKITGLYEYKTGSANYLLIVSNGKLYKIPQSVLDDDSTWGTLTPTLIGSVGDYDTTFFSFGGKVYMLNGHSYMSYDGTNLVTSVTGYTPLVLFGCNPASGSGTEYDQINMINPQKHMTFNGNGSATTYQLAQKNIASVDKVIVNGTQLSSGYSSNLTNGTVTFTTAPSNGIDNVDIYWSKNDGNRGFIDGMRAGIVYGGNVDTKVFLYGNTNEQNRIRYSGTAGGAPSAEYFPATYQLDVGVKNFAVTDLTRQYDRLIATTNRPEAYTIGIDLIDVNGTSTPSVITLPLNEVHGNIAFAQGQVINNNPVTIEDNQIIEWTATNIRDERNMQIISDKILADIQDLNLSTAKTCDFQAKGQLWVAVADKIYIYGYLNDVIKLSGKTGRRYTYSRIQLPVDSDLFQVIGDYMYMSTTTGKLMKWDKNYQDFDGTTINAHWEMNFSNFGASYLRKTMRKVWVTMQPQSHSSADIGWVTNKNECENPKTIAYNMSVLDDADFANWSFKVSTNPQPFRLKLKAKKFTNLKITIDNNNTDDCTILELALKTETSGESK